MGGIYGLHNGAPERAIVEVKIWGRNDYDKAQQQVESCWTSDVAVGAVAQLSDSEVSDWPEKYQRDCLGAADKVERLSVDDSLIRAVFMCNSTTFDGQTARVGHFLLRVPRKN